MSAGPLSELLPALRGFPRLKQLTLEAEIDEDFILPTAELRHLPALERLDVCSFGSMALSEPLPRLTSLAVGYAFRLEVGAGAALPSLRSLESEAVDVVVLRGSLPRLTRLVIRAEEAVHETTLVSIQKLACGCFLPATQPRCSALADKAAIGLKQPYSGERESCVPTPAAGLAPSDLSAL